MLYRDIRDLITNDIRHIFNAKAQGPVSGEVTGRQNYIEEIVYLPIYGAALKSRVTPAPGEWKYQSAVPVEIKRDIRLVLSTTCI
ncbi:hypothetical protein TNCV_4597491 [Trichonephila clavipes]|nr:hypothetical protein TNCV_4597491 [Trichonephila clavipes]